MKNEYKVKETDFGTKQVIRYKVHIVMNNYKESRELKNLTVEEVSEKLSISKTCDI